MAAPQTGSPQNIQIEAYQQHRENRFPHLLLDVRESWEYALGHMPDAVNIPLNDLPDHLEELPRDQPIVVVCEHGIRSVYGAQYLAQVGFEGIYNLLGGTSEWRARGLPLEA
ncbi:MAG: rhodanese-like domain-containing protein [Anaerolineae bacterium]|nr:rhodanese-like domain-containing protein [Anaerolineae bacterium]